MALHALSPRTRSRLNGALALFFALQTTQLVLVRLGFRLWPFCSYDMFAQRAASNPQTLQVTLIDDQGDATRVHPGAVLPIEFFRANELIYEVFVRGRDSERQQRLAADILRRLNEEPWAAFDETWAASAPRGKRRFVALEVERVEQGFRRAPRGVELVPIRREPVFRGPALLAVGGRS